MTPIQLKVDDVNYLVHVWDTAGTPQYRSVVPMFCRDTDIAIIVYDVTNKSSFDRINDWYEFVHKNSDPALIIVGNKIDLVYGLEVSSKSRTNDSVIENDENAKNDNNDNQAIREVSKKEAIQISKSLNASYFETSCLTHEGISELKEGICQIISTIDVSSLIYSKGINGSQNIQMQTLQQKKKCGC